MHSKVVAIKMSGRHLILVICSGRELADLEEVEAERLHLSQHAVECRRANGYRLPIAAAVPARAARPELTSNERTVLGGTATTPILWLRMTAASGSRAGEPRRRGRPV